MDFENKHVLVTGGAGFIGSNIVEYLLEETKVKKVTVLDNLSTGFQSNIDLFSKHPKYEFIKGDIANEEDCRKACVGVDMICNQAALGSVPRSMKTPIVSCEANIIGFMTLVYVAREMGIKRIVYASSSSVFGDNTEKKKRDGELGEPLSVYAMTKLFNEKVGTIFTKAFGMEIIGLRYFNIYGRRQSVKGEYPAVIPIFMNKVKTNQDITIFGDGSFSRDFTHITNAIRANVLGMTTTNPECFGKIFNIGCDNSTTILELAEKIKRQWDKPNTKIHFGEKRMGDVPNSHADLTVTKKLLGYEPVVHMDQGLYIIVF